MKLTKIGAFIHRSKIPIEIENDKEYKRVTIRINHNGVSLRDIEIGKKIGTKKQFILKAGQFILSKIDARYGAFGIAPQEVDNAIITGNFWAYDVDFNKVNIEWFNQFTNSKNFYELCERASSGITHRKYLDESFFLNYEIQLPSIEEQFLQIEKIKNLQIKFRSLTLEQSRQLDLIKKLRQQILKDAMQGKLVPQNENDEPASLLLEKIKKEKILSGKKEKVLPRIKPEDTLYKIPQNWKWCRLGEICNKIGSGSTPKGGNYSEAGFPFFRSQNIYNDGLVFDDIKTVSNEVQNRMKGTAVIPDDLLLNITGGSLGRCALVPKDFKEGNVSQHVCIIRPININNKFLHSYILSPIFQKFIFSSTTGAGREGLPKYNLEQFVVPLPSLSEQNRIVSKIEELMNLCEQLEASIKSNQEYTNLLYQTALKEALQPEGSESVLDANMVSTAKSSNKKGKVIKLKPTNTDYYKRSILAAEIVWQLHKEPTLGHLKLQKLIYLCQQSAQMQLHTNFLRQAMGPYDPQLMRSIDKQLKEKKWFEYHMDQILKYHPLENAGQHHDDFLQYFSSENESIQFIIDTFRSTKSDTIEIVATLYACIKNIINEGTIFSEELLIQRFYEWSKEKKKFEENEVKRVFSRMKAKGIIPNGFIS